MRDSHREHPKTNQQSKRDYVLYGRITPSMPTAQKICRMCVRGAWAWIDS